MTHKPYIEYTIQADEVHQEMMVALLDHQGYEGFIQEEHELLVYIDVDLKDEDQLKEILQQCGLPGTFQSKVIAPRNWNEEWESGFSPVAIDQKVYIRASFHEPQPDYTYDILVQPKMSFGTGHHDTTASVMKLMLDLDFKNKRVFDYGCGTAILSVLASKLGAGFIFCNDIDDWIEENVIENLALNGVNNVTYGMGDISLVAGKTFDIILANINRNVLLDSFSHLDMALLPGGTIVISGFYAEDVTALKAAMPANWTTSQQVTSERGWTALLIHKL